MKKCFFILLQNRFGKKKKDKQGKNFHPQQNQYWNWNAWIRDSLFFF